MYIIEPSGEMIYEVYEIEEASACSMVYDEPSADLCLHRRGFMKKNIFHIGELSNLFNISVDSIRYYEKKGLICPTRNEENGYREYSLADFQTLVIIRELIGLGFHKEQIGDFLANRNIESTMKMLETELSIITKRIQTMQRKKKELKYRIQSLQKVLEESQDETIRLKTFPERPVTMISTENLPDAYVDYSLVQYMKQNHRQLNTIGFCDCYTLDLEGSNPNSDYYRTENVFFLSSPAPAKSTYSLPAGNYLCLYYHGSLKQTKERMPSLYEYAKAQQLKVIGHPIELCHIDSYETNQENEFVIELELPVE